MVRFWWILDFSAVKKVSDYCTLIYWFTANVSTVIMMTPSGMHGNQVNMPADNTNDILASTVGKTLIINEAAISNASAENDCRHNVLDALYADMTSNHSGNRCVVLVGSETGIDALFANADKALSGLFGPKRLVRFEPFTRSQLEQIMQKKLQEQDLFVTPEAMQTAMDTLETVRMRQTFDNARAVEGLLTSANRNFEVRTSREGSPMFQSDRMLEPEDVAVNPRETTVSVRNALQDLVADGIISELERYQKEIKISWLMGRDPCERIPCALVFKGPCGKPILIPLWHSSTNRPIQ